VLPGGAWVDVESALDGLHRAEAAAARRTYDEAWGPARLAQHIAMRPFEEAPYREAGYRLLMQVLEARVEVAEATLVFDRLRQRLREDLGLAPVPETTAVYERVLRRAAG